MKNLQNVSYTSSLIQHVIADLNQRIPRQTQFIIFCRSYLSSTGSNLDSFHPEEVRFSYSSIIQQCTENKSLLDLQKIQSYLIKNGLCHLPMGNKLIDAYLKCGSRVGARKLFDEMPERHVVIWNSMIAAYMREKRSKEAIELYNRMVFEGVFPDEYTFSSIFKAFSNLSLIPKGRKAHGQAVVLGLELSNVFVGSALVDMYSKFGNMKDAKLVSDRVGEQDVVLVTALIVGYTQQGQDVEALHVFVDMLVKGIKPNDFTFASTLIGCGNLEDLKTGQSIHCLVTKLGYVSAVASQTSLLTMYSKCGMVDDSFKVFEGLSCPNQVTWTSLMAGLLHNGKEETSLLQFKKMMLSSVNPNSFTLCNAVRACSRLAMLETGKQVHGVITKHGLSKNKYTGASLIDMYGKCGIAEMARSVFDSLTETDLVSMNSMVYSYALNGLGHEALDLFNRMRELGLQLNDVTFISALLACTNAGLVEEGREIFTYLKEKSKIKLNNEHYACMVDLLGRSGRLEEAEMLVKQIKNPDVVLWKILLSACRVHGEVEMAERVMSKVLELAPTDEGTRILLSNLYAFTNNWNQVIEMKTTIRDMKLKKSPAMSWVEIGREIHTFMAGDLSHPQSKEIVGELEELIQRTKDLGYVPDTRFVLQHMEEEKKERSLYYHSEKLAIAFALLMTRDKTIGVRILKNLRVCGDCHNWIKFVTVAVGREITARDSKRFHHFKNGACSCRDYW